MKTPLISPELLEMLKARFDVPVGKNDNERQAQWKNAQRAVILDLEHLHEAQREMQADATVVDPRSKD